MKIVTTGSLRLEGWSKGGGDDQILLHYTARSGYLRRLVEDGINLIVVDGADADWQFWTTTPKTNPATRRIPLIVAADDPQQRQQALLAGADFVYTRADLEHRFGLLLHDHAQTVNPDTVEQLTCDCRGPLPELAQEGIARFNAGEYYRQHDLFEALWMETASPVRDLYRAILQVGVAYYQIERRNYRGAQKMLLRSVQWLALLPDVCQGVDVASLRADSYRVRAELERLGEANISEFDLALLRPVKLLQ